MQIDFLLSYTDELAVDSHFQPQNLLSVTKILPENNMFL